MRARRGGGGRRRTGLFRTPASEDAMLKRTLLALPVLAALAAGSASAQAPRQLAIDSSANNQQLAQAVAHKLSGSGKLNQYQLDISAQGGRVELVGQVANPQQAME